MSIDLKYVKKGEIKQHAIDGPNRGEKNIYIYLYYCRGKKILAFT